MQVERGAISPASEGLKLTVRAEAIKILPCAGLFLTRALWQDYKLLTVSTHLGIRTALPDDAEKTLYILPRSWIIYFSFLFFLWRGKGMNTFEQSEQ